MIIGVALVVDELSKGQHLVFRYPLSTPSSVLNSHPGRWTPLLTHPSPSIALTASTATAALLKYHNDYLSITPNNFARLFRPKSQFHNKVAADSHAHIQHRTLFLPFFAACMYISLNLPIPTRTGVGADHRRPHIHMLSLPLYRRKPRG